MCRMMPCGVWNAVAKPWGTEWVTGMNSHVERADLAALAVVHRDELGAVEQAGLLDAVAGQAEGERRAVDRERQLAQQERQAADVVLVAVGGDAAVDAVGVLAQVGEVGQDEVDAEHVEVGEHQPAVEQHDLAVDLDAGAVAADLAETAEEGDLDGSSAIGPPPLALRSSALAASDLACRSSCSRVQPSVHLERSVLEAGGRAHGQSALAGRAAEGAQHGLGRHGVGGGVAGLEVVATRAAGR